MLQEGKRNTGIFMLLFALLLATSLLSARFGAVSISMEDILSAGRHFFAPGGVPSLNERIFMDIRLPRTLLCIVVGASLAVGGTLMQALFRNPIVEPGLIGTSSGAAFGSALYFVLGAAFRITASQWTLPLAAAIGAVLSTSMVFMLSRSKQTGKSTVVVLLLTGLAVNALFMSGVGFLSYIARDPQARSITFWGLGNLSGANWKSVQIVGVTTVICILAAGRCTKHLNALMLGEEEARFLGVGIDRLKLTVLLINVVMIATATAFVGVISFIGLVVPHVLRLLRGSDNRFLVMASALLGGILLSLSDLMARMLLRPAELPVGIVTSVVGVPVFIFLLRRKNNYF